MTSTSINTILLVEDHATTRNALRLLLEDENYTVVEAHDAKQALACVTRNAPSLIVTDLGLPGLNGIELTKAIRDLRRRISHIPIIMLTAADISDNRIRAIAAGCNAFLPKPVDFLTLSSTIANLIKSHERKRSH
jgi:CheY-like chemotaxis protein